MDEVAADLRAAALDALAAMRDDRALVALPPRARRRRRAGVRAAAVRVAGAVGGLGLAGRLAAHLTDPDQDVRRAVAATLARLPWPSPAADLACAVIAAVSGAAPRMSPTGAAVAPRTPLDAAERRALGDVLERAVDVTDAAALEAAYMTAPWQAHAVLARGLAAAHGRARWSSPRVVDALLGDLAGDDELAPAAADALDGAALTSNEEAELSLVFARAEASLRARLAPALARFPAGVRALMGTLHDPDVGAPLRASVAWALAGAAGGGAALREAAESPEPAVAANARAALSSPSPEQRRLTWTAVRLTAADGAPWPHRWIAVTPAGGLPVWALTDETGRARVVGLPDEEATVTVPPE